MAYDKRTDVSGRTQEPIELLFNLDHPDRLAVVTEIDEDGTDEEDDDLIDDEADSTEDELQRRFDRMTFVVATKKLDLRPQWVRVTDVFKSESDAGFLKRAGVSGFASAADDVRVHRRDRLGGVVREYVLAA